MSEKNEGNTVKKIRSTEQILVLAILLFTYFLETFQVAYAQKAEDLPQIVSWQDGKGYQSDGTFIADGWGYDTVNPAGKYVLFDENGMVQLRTETMDPVNAEDEYSGTELEPANIAVRAEIFEGFTGKVHVTIEENGGIKKDLFRPDDIYDQYYYIPMCREGILQIVLLTEKRKREKLKQSLFSRFSIKREKEYAAYNVCDENGNPIYLVYDLEMRQLCRIKQELLWRPSVSIVCMDYQAETIREYLGEKVIIYELNAENVMKYLINDLGE